MENTITAIRSSNRGQQINVFVGGKLTFSLPATAVRQYQVGQALSTAQLNELTITDQQWRCRNVALRYLNYRPRSEAELRQRLEQRGFESTIISHVLTALKADGLVNDDAFALFWTENRQSFRPRSQRFTKMELKRKGVSGDVIDGVVASIDDDRNAYKVALAQSERCGADYATFRRRLGNFLLRRGFEYEVINNTVKRIWQERMEKLNSSSSPKIEGGGLK